MKRFILHHITCTKCNQVKPIVRSTNKLKVLICDNCMVIEKAKYNKEYQKTYRKTPRSKLASA